MAIRPTIGVIGCGQWGRNLVRNMHQLGLLCAVAEPSESGRAKAREIAPSVPIHESADAVLSDPHIQAVMVATPAETHFPVASAAIAAGKDVFVEKPMTIDVEDARALIGQADAAGRILMVGHLLEYHPAILRIHELVQSGELGKIRYVISNRLNLGKIRTEENALWSFAPHDIAVILRLVGTMPFEVVATGGCYVQPNIADVTVTQLLFDNGARSHIFVSWLHPFKEQKLVVIGSKKMVCFDDISKKLTLTDLKVEWEEGQPVPVRAPGIEVEFPVDEPLREECLHFAECVTKRTEARTDGRNGLRVLQILHAAQRSMITNGRPVALGSELEPPRSTSQGVAPLAAGKSKAAPAANRPYARI